MTEAREPLCAAAAPCSTCPYRKDVPSGVWDPSEYEKLLAYDHETHAQPTAVFMCHGSEKEHESRLCTGWLQCHKYELLAVRLVSILGEGVCDGVHDVIRDHPVEVFETATAAAAHGLAEVDHPGEDACNAVARLRRFREGDDRE